MRAAVEHEQTILQRPIGDHVELGACALERTKIAAGIFGRVLQARPRRIVIRDRDPLDRRQIHDPDGEVPRAARTRCHVILDVLRNACEHELEARRARSRLHRHLLPLGRALVAGVEGDLRRQEPRIARSDLELGQRRRDAMRAGPQQVGAVSDVPRLRRDEPQQRSQQRDAKTEPRDQPAVRCERFRRDRPRDLQGVRRQQIQERFVALPVDERLEALRKCRRSLLGVPRGSAPREPCDGETHAEDDRRRQRGKQHDARERQTSVGGRERGERHREHDRRAKRGAGDDRRSARQRVETQTVLEPCGVGVELLSRAHRASHVRCPRVARRDTGWPPAIPTARRPALSALCTTRR